jgi:hypothetical protein
MMVNILAVAMRVMQRIFNSGRIRLFLRQSEYVRPPNDMPLHLIGAPTLAEYREICGVLLEIRLN